MNLFNNKNQKLLFYHTIIREFFYSLSKLGWAYLLTQGMSLMIVIGGLFLYRFLSSKKLLFWSRKYFHKLTPKLQMFLAVLVQSVLIISFYFAPNNLYFFGLTIFFNCLSEVFYWPIRHNLFRLTVEKDKIGSNEALSKNTKNLAIMIGYLVSGFGLHFNPLITLVVGSGGMLLSYFPLSQISLDELFKSDKNFLKHFFNLKTKLNLIKTEKSIRLLLLISMVSELINGLIPLLIIFYGSTLIELGILFMFLQMITLIFHYFIGKYEDTNIKYLFNISLISLILCFVLFSFLENKYLSILLILFNIFGMGLSIAIMSKTQKMVKNKFSGYDGGYISSWCGNVGRSFIVLVIPFIYIIQNPAIFHLPILWVCLLGISGIYFTNKEK